MHYAVTPVFSRHLLSFWPSLAAGTGSPSVLLRLQLLQCWEQAGCSSFNSWPRDYLAAGRLPGSLSSVVRMEPLSFLKDASALLPAAADILVLALLTPGHHASSISPSSSNCAPLFSPLCQYLGSPILLSAILLLQLLFLPWSFA